MPLITKIDGYYSEKQGKSYKGCKGFEDFREVIARKDIDALEVVTCEEANKMLSHPMREPWASVYKDYTV